MWHNSASGFGGISNFQQRNFKHFSPTPLPGHSSAYYKAYWASSMSSIPSYNSKGLIIIMQFLKQKAKKRNPLNDMKKCPNYQEKIQRHECMKEWSRTELGAGHQSTSWESVIWLATRPLFCVFFNVFYVSRFSEKRATGMSPILSTFRGSLLTSGRWQLRCSGVSRVQTNLLWPCSIVYSQINAPTWKRIRTASKQL